jgi:hypothetical protein
MLLVIIMIARRVGKKWGSFVRHTLFLVPFTTRENHHAICDSNKNICYNTIVNNTILLLYIYYTILLN